MKKILLVLGILLSSSPAFAETEWDESENFTSATRQEIRDLEVLHFRAQQLIEGGNMRAAVSIYWEIILLEPDDDAAYTNLGQLYLVLGDNARAKDAFQNALHINPENEAAQAGFFKITRPDEFPT